MICVLLYHVDPAEWEEELDRYPYKERIHLLFSELSGVVIGRLHGYTCTTSEGGAAVIPLRVGWES